MKSSEDIITSPSVLGPSTSDPQDWSYFDFVSNLHPIDELALESFSAMVTERASPPPPPPLSTSPLQDMQKETSFVESNHRDEVPIDDDQFNTHSDDPFNSVMSLLQPGELPELVESDFDMKTKDVPEEDDKNEKMRLSEVSVEVDVSLEVEGNRSVEEFLLGLTVAGQTDDGILNELSGFIPTSNMNPFFGSEAPPGLEFAENVGVQYHKSDISNLNLDDSLQPIKTNESSAASSSIMSEECHKQQVSHGKMVGSNRVSTKRKRKKSTRMSQNEYRKRCNCKKSECLKLYCECFSAEQYCSDSCCCKDCLNRIEYEDTVYLVSQQCESKNPLAFAPKVIKETSNSPTNIMVAENEVPPSLARHKKGCNCKKSMCQKKYCECYQAEVGCTTACQCEGCHNTFGTRAGSSSRAWGNTSDEKTDAQGISSEPGYQQLANNFSSTYASNLSSSNNHIPEALTSNLTNRNDCPEATLAPFPPSVSGPPHWSRLSTVIPAPQPFESMASSKPSFNYHLYGTMTENVRLTPTNQQSASTSTSYFQPERLSSNPWLDLKSSQQLTWQTMPTYPSLLPYMNFNGSSAQNEGDRKDFIGDQ